MLAGSSGRIGEGYSGRIITAPRPVITGQRPEVTCFGAFASWGENRRGRFIHEELGGALQIDHQGIINRGQFERRLTNPGSQGRAIQINALGAVDLRLPIERQVVRVF